MARRSAVGRCVHPILHRCREFAITNSEALVAGAAQLAAAATPD
ncbi:MAG: hypothetical protein U5O16_30085 [Rhodococcus sp. (in: high G+C Gram-positive bacteria)]|nr:hypothetical protein [Rhodococcus sp. (in: high G+C Gram-positive bacteria)]